MTSINNQTILIVDDDSLILDMLGVMLADLGYSVITACSGEEALHKAAEFKRIDILLTDIMMPNMNGIELAKKFNRLIPETKIFFMSGHVLPSLNIHEPLEENHVIFEKPFSIDRLTAEFAKALTY
jgi:CheY-like chemotaxis protein